MRPLAITAAAVVALACAGPALAAMPKSGYLIFKEVRSGSLTEVRTKGTGKLVFSGTSLHGKSKKSSNEACMDDTFVLLGTQWTKFESYYVNPASVPGYLNDKKVTEELKQSARAWDGNFRTDCKKPKGKSDYEVDYGGKTGRHATLVTELVSDGVNTVSFDSLAGTICDGATACTVIDYDEKGINEADMSFERDLTRYGFQDFYTTDDTTWFNEVGGRWAISDVGTHEFGHFAGLDHTWESPALTMYPFIHDGDDSLGLGDMLGLLAIY